MAVGKRELEDINWRDDYRSLFQVVLLEIGTTKWGNTQVGNRDQEKVFSSGEVHYFCMTIQCGRWMIY